jgi:hypothetical protein
MYYNSSRALPARLVTLTGCKAAGGRQLSQQWSRSQGSGLRRALQWPLRAQPAHLLSLSMHTEPLAVTAAARSLASVWWGMAGAAEVKRCGGPTPSAAVLGAPTVAGPSAPRVLGLTAVGWSGLMSDAACAALSWRTQLSQQYWPSVSFLFILNEHAAASTHSAHLVCSSLHKAPSATLSASASRGDVGAA